MNHNKIIAENKYQLDNKLDWINLWMTKVQFTLLFVNCTYEYLNYSNELF